MKTTDIRRAIEAGQWTTVRGLASAAAGAMHGLWNVAMDAEHDGKVDPKRALYLLGRYERIGFC